MILEVLNLAAMYGMDDMLLTMAAVFCDELRLATTTAADASTWFSALSDAMQQLEAKPPQHLDQWQEVRKAALAGIQRTLPASAGCRAFGS